MRKKKGRNPLKVGTKIIVGKDTGMKGTILAHTILPVEESYATQVHYIVRLEESLDHRHDKFGRFNIPLVVIHPDNLRRLGEKSPKVVNMLDHHLYCEDSAGGWRIRTDAPTKIQRKALKWIEHKMNRRLTVRRMARELIRRGYKARIVAGLN